MDKIDKAIESAIANLSVDNLKVTKEQIEQVKDNLQNKIKEKEGKENGKNR